MDAIELIPTLFITGAIIYYFATIEGMPPEAGSGLAIFSIFLIILIGQAWSGFIGLFLKR